MALFVKKGNYIWNIETEYQGEITGENAIEYRIGWFFNAKSGEGYENETVPKNFVENLVEDMEAESIKAEEIAGAKYEGELVEQAVRVRRELDERVIKYLEGIDRAITRTNTWYNRLGQQDETEGNTEARKVEKETLETVSRIFDEEVGKEGEFSEATIKRIRTREDARQRKIEEETEG